MTPLQRGDLLAASRVVRRSGYVVVRRDAVDERLAEVKRLTDAASTALDALRNDRRCLALQTLANALEGGAE